jgi:hypothetical protein
MVLIPDCHFHYSTKFAVKCVGCETAILKQFVEMNRNGRDECWHPECYMISKVRSSLECHGQNPLMTVLERPACVQEFQHTLQFRRQLDGLATRNHTCQRRQPYEPIQRFRNHSRRAQGQTGKDGNQSATDLACAIWL